MVLAMVSVQEWAGAILAGRGNIRSEAKELKITMPLCSMNYYLCV
jgi:hypothetical protein